MHTHKPLQCRVRSLGANHIGDATARAALTALPKCVALIDFVYGSSPAQPGIVRATAHTGDACALDVAGTGATTSTKDWASSWTRPLPATKQKLERSPVRVWNERQHEHTHTNAANTDRVLLWRMDDPSCDDDALRDRAWPAVRRPRIRCACAAPARVSTTCAAPARNSTSAATGWAAAAPAATSARPASPTTATTAASAAGRPTAAAAASVRPVDAHDRRGHGQNLLLEQRHQGIVVDAPRAVIILQPRPASATPRPTSEPASPGRRRRCCTAATAAAGAATACDHCARARRHAWRHRRRRLRRPADGQGSRIRLARLRRCRAAPGQHRGAGRGPRRPQGSRRCRVHNRVPRSERVWSVVVHRHMH